MTQSIELVKGEMALAKIELNEKALMLIQTTISLIFAFSVFGCPQSKNSAANTRKILKSQTGLAAFYSSALHGKKTASGEKFDNTDLVAAHPSYPLGTMARVTNLKNNKSIEVRIIDRGPTRESRSEGVIIDLSKVAAKKLNFIREGRARVRVDVLEWGKRSKKSMK